MLYRSQFILDLGTCGTALAWPARSQWMELTREPLETIGYGSERMAIEDLERWTRAFPQIRSAEAILTEVSK